MNYKLRSRRPFQIKTLTLLQKNPFLLFHRNLILLRPVDTFPASQTTMHVAWLQVKLATPEGSVKDGHIVQSAAARIPTGCPQLFSLDFAIIIASL